MEEQLISHLSKLVSENRLKAFRSVIEKRTRYLTVVLEDIYQPHNASAVLRSCDCFGIQDVHIIENQNEYNINPDVALGASKWLNLNKYSENNNNTLETIKTLKKQGYRIVATTPHTNDIKLEDYDLSKGPSALFFGTEKLGLSKIMMDNADEFVKIPMHGFTESFNISVSASIILYHLTTILKNGSNINWQLSQSEKNQILIQWFKESIKKSDIIIADFMKNYP